jgi:hypothetical protein
VKAIQDGTVVERLTEGNTKTLRNYIFTVLEAGLRPGEV